MFRVVFLGNTASAPTKNDFTSCFALKSGGVFLFDACEGVQQKLMLYGVSISKVECIFISHLHADHFLGVFGLLQTMKLYGRTASLKIFGPLGSKAFFSKILALNPLSTSFPVEIIDVRAVKEKKVFDNGAFQVRAFPVNHNTLALGFVIQEHSKRKFDLNKARECGISGKNFSLLEKKGKLSISVKGKKKTISYSSVTFEVPGKKVVYSGDTAPCKSLSIAAKLADLLICDSTFSIDDSSHAVEKFHSTATDCAKIARSAGAKLLVLTHFSNRYSDLKVLEKEASSIFRQTAVARPGLEILV